MSAQTCNGQQQRQQQLLPLLQRRPACSMPARRKMGVVGQMAATAINQIQEQGEKNARRPILALYAFMETVWCWAAFCFFVNHQDVTKLAPIDLKPDRYIWALLIRGGASFSGMIGVSKRSLRQTKVYLLSIPFGFVVAFVVLVPLVWTECGCTGPLRHPWSNRPDYNFQQCDVLASFGEGVVNPLPKLKKLVPAPPKIPIPHGLFPQESDVFDDDETMGVHLMYDEHGWTNMTNISNIWRKTCTCEGGLAVRVPWQWKENDWLPSCNWDFDDVKLRYSAWCYLSKAATEACMTEFPSDVYFDKQPNDTDARMWSRALCTNAGITLAQTRRRHGKHRPLCACSWTGLRPGFQKNLNLNLLMQFDGFIGSVCRSWRHGETPWCFVGTDTACIDKSLEKPINDARVISPHSRALDVDQFRSTIPCTGDLAVRNAAQQCRLWIFALVMTAVFLQVLAFPAAFSLYIYIKNRCFDVVRIQEPWDVEFSSDDGDSQNDFQVEEDPARSRCAFCYWCWFCRNRARWRRRDTCTQVIEPRVSAGIEMAIKEPGAEPTLQAPENDEHFQAPKGRHSSRTSFSSTPEDLGPMSRSSQPSSQPSAKSLPRSQSSSHRRSSFGTSWFGNQISLR